LSNYRKLRKGEYCIYEDSDLYKGIGTNKNNYGKCVKVRSTEYLDKYIEIRGIDDSLDETTPNPYETTPIVDGTTPIPDETTPGPDGTTPIPDETTQIPDETTPGPDETTQIPDETTPGPDETTPIPDETTDIIDPTNDALCDLKSSKAKNCIIGYYLKDDVNGLVSDEDTTGTLYYCSTSTSCNEVEETDILPGYYRNADRTQNSSLPYIKCSKGSNNCEAITPDLTATDDCSSAGEGGLIGVKDMNNDSSPVIYKLCLNNKKTGNAVSLSNVSQYFVNIDKSNIFGQSEGHYVLVDIDSYGNVLKNEHENKKFQYTDNEFRIQSRSNNGEACSDETLIEFNLIDNENYYYSKEE